MKLLEDRIIKEGIVDTGDVLKVGGFLNHQLDISLLRSMGQEFVSLFGDSHITRILTVEASGIAIACITAQCFSQLYNQNIPVLFAKKSKSSNLGSDIYSAQAYSYTHQNNYNIIVSKQYLDSNDRVLLIDDFLAKGSALMALIEICHQAGAEIAGAGIAIEKEYQQGGNKIRQQGIRVESLARIISMNPETGVIFRHTAV